MAWDRGGRSPDAHPMFDINTETLAFKKLHAMADKL
jgi:hypothetical protein